MKRIGILTWIKIGIIIMMLLCLLSMPYGFYTLVRFGAMIGFGVLAYTAWISNRTRLAIAYGALVLLFQPFIKLTLGRDIWNIVDVAVAVFLIIVIIKFRQ